MKDDHIEFNCLEVNQPIGVFYVGAINARDVLAISYADVARLDARDIEKVIGIQRELKPDRVKELKQYVRNVDATFPTSVILSVSSDDAQYNPKTGTMTIRKDENVAKIIDGQHRIAGLDGFNDRFDLNTTIFIDMDLADQAMTFATINLTQTKVNRSLVYELYEFQHTRSPQKSCHSIARLLNRESGSPLEGRIKILGKAIGQSDFEFITQATFVTECMAYISKNPMADRDALKRRKPLPEVSDAELDRLIFRTLFDQNKDAVIADVIWNYFAAIENKWPDAWSSSARGQILNRTQGFIALMKFLGPVYRAKRKPNGNLSRDAVEAVLKPVRLKDRDFTIENFPPGTGGQSKLVNDLREATDL